jgi:hypothetical protein
LGCLQSESQKTKERLDFKVITKRSVQSEVKQGDRQGAGKGARPNKKLKKQRAKETKSQRNKESKKQRVKEIKS